MATLDKVNAELRTRIEWVLRKSMGHLVVNSAYRDRAEQQKLYDRYVKSGFNPKYLAAKPGLSNHEKGLAVDVGCAPQFDALRKDLFRQASLRTPIPGEPWHAELSAVRRPLPQETASQKAEGTMTNPVVDFKLTKTGKGYYFLLRDGAVITFGDALFAGGRGGDAKENAAFKAIELTPTGLGYYLVGEDGGVFTFGDAVFLGAAVDHTK